jgi:hypothetical protein
MAVGFPVKDDYATGDVLTAANMNDFAGTLNTVPNVIGGFAAGKNKIINGDFRINQRAFSSTTSNAVYTFDRFATRITGDGTATYSAQTFTPGAAPVAGYESTNYMRIVTASQTTTAVRTTLRQSVEDVRTFAGQTVTFSFWAKASSGAPKMAGLLAQEFGSGGSAGVSTPLGTVTISTSWARYSFTVSLPSISGKTIGTGSFLLVDLCVSAGSDLNTAYSSIGIQNNTFEMWGWQVEAGSIATPFQTATGTIQGELAACQRYYYRAGGDTVYQLFASGWGANTNTAYLTMNMPVSMRTSPGTLDYSTVAINDLVIAPIAVTNLTLTGGYLGKNTASLTATVAAGLVAKNAYNLSANNSTSGYVGLSAEL